MFKIVLIGEAKNAKKTIVKNINGPFLYIDNMRMMLGVDFFQSQYQHHNIRAKVSFWNVHSNSRYLLLYPQFIRGSKAVLVVFDVSNRQSFENLQYWLGLAKSKQIEQPYAFLIGNKTDLQRSVSFEQASEMAAKWGVIYIQLYATSLIDVRNLVQEVIAFIANRFIQ